MPGGPCWVPRRPALPVGRAPVPLKDFRTLGALVETNTLRLSLRGLGFPVVSHPRFLDRGWV